MGVRSNDHQRVSGKQYFEHEVQTNTDVFIDGDLTVKGDITVQGDDIDVKGTNIAVSGTTYGVGAIGTSSYGAPRLFRWTENDVIVTQINVDITGLANKGDAANDVIGLAAGGAAYIYRNVVADNGIIFKYEIGCLEVPGQGTATITTDIDFAWNTSATLAYDGAAGTAEIDTGGFAAVGGVSSGIGVVANDYLYIVEGDNAGTTGVYNAGQFIIKLYGYPVLGS